MGEDRTILHCDLNGFYASVEALSHPEIGDNPMAVAGDPKNRHGIILAKNESAKSYGVSTGEAIWQARRKCPKLIILPPSHGKYAEYSKKINALYARFTDKVEPFGIDESWLDVGGSRKLFGGGKQIADTLRALVKKEFSLTISVGVSYNKVFAKLASDYKKPDATTVFDRSSLDLIRSLPAKDLLFIGRSTSESLAKMGIKTIGELADSNQRTLELRFGKFGRTMREYARGEDNSPVSDYGAIEEAKSIGNSITFARDLLGEADIRAGFTKVAEKVSRRLNDAALKCSAMQVTIKGADFSYMTRQCRIDKASNSISTLVKYALGLAERSWDMGSAVRMLGISGHCLSGEGAPVQCELFSDPETENSARREAAEHAFIEIKRKFGASSIEFGDVLDRDL